MVCDSYNNSNFGITWYFSRNTVQIYVLFAYFHKIFGIMHFCGEAKNHWDGVLCHCIQCCM